MEWVLHEDPRGLVVRASCVEYRSSREWMRYRHVPSAIGPVTIEVVRDMGLWHAEISWRDQRSVFPISPDGMCRTCGRLIIDVAVTAEALVLVRH